ncbi:uncharacterized protein LOC112905138 isoform X1 [Agrilus planipennis]|uniref:Uncharacterized protein LOC112905138 isoform X1 n=1 Tax=Agrilus planipennis TaxID=224129 RepID=A0A7F5R9U2_AGRPL|nr:uncharacterized protein LOC112905138 isoform X1 [Agrilus planipennis]
MKRKNSQWCDDEPEFAKRSDNKKPKRRDSGELTHVRGSLPEDMLSGDARRFFKIIQVLVPMKAETIKVADRKVIRETADLLMKSLVQMAGVVKELRHTISKKDEEIKQARESATKTVSTPPLMSYSDRLKSGNNVPLKPRVNETSFPVQIGSKKAGKDSDFIKEVVMRTVDPIKNNIAVKNVRATKSGNIVIDCARQEDAEKIKLSLSVQAKDEVEVKDIKKRWPSVRIDRISKELNARDIHETILGHNDFIDEYCGNDVNKFKTHFRQLAVFETGGNKETYSADFEVNPTLRVKMLDRPIYLNWQRVWVRDHFSMLQCFQCYDFGHLSKNCKIKEQLCGKCGGKHHSKDCKSKTTSCVVCVRSNKDKKRAPVNTDHDAKSSSCPTMNRIRNSILSNIDFYGN